METINAIGPIGLVVRGDKVYQYYKNLDGKQILFEDDFKKRIRVFSIPEKKNEVLKKIKSLGFEKAVAIEGVVYKGFGDEKVSLISFDVQGKNREIESLKLRLKSIQGVVGVESCISNFKEQEYFISKSEEKGNFSLPGYFLPTQITYKPETREVVEISQLELKNREEISQHLEKLKEILVLWTVDYETFGDEIVVATAKASNGFSRTFVINQNLELAEEFKNLGIEVELVPDEETLIRKLYEHRKNADVEIIHGSSLLEKKKDYAIFPSTNGRPTSKFDIPIHYKNVSSIGVVTSEEIMPSGDSLYTIKHQEHPEKRSLEELLEFYLNENILQKTDYNEFSVYKILKSSSDVIEHKEEIKRTLMHNIQDALGHLKISEYLLFDQAFLVLPLLYSLRIEDVFSKTMEEIGEAVLTSKFFKRKVFPKMSNQFVRLREEKEKIRGKYEVVVSEDYGERIKGKWIYLSYCFIPQILFENKEEFEPFLLEVFEDLFRLKKDLGVFGIDEITKKHLIFDPYSFAINCVSACLLLGRKNFTSEEISNKLFNLFQKKYKELIESRKLGNCELVYISPFGRRAFISGTLEEIEKAVKETKNNYPFLLTDYNKHLDTFIPLNKKQALATESGKIVKIGWRGASRFDPKIIREAEKSIIKKFVEEGKKAAYFELMLKIEELEKVRTLEDYKISGRLNKNPEEYEKESFKLRILKEAVEEYRRIFGRKPGFIDFYVTEKGIDFSSLPTSKIDVGFYKNYLFERVKPVLNVIGIKPHAEIKKLTDYL